MHPLPSEPRRCHTNDFAIKGDTLPIRAFDTSVLLRVASVKRAWIC